MLKSAFGKRERERERERGRERVYPPCGAILPLNSMRFYAFFERLWYDDDDDDLVLR